MADPPGPPSGRASPSPGPARRPRAPTITIDTSAVRHSSDNSANMEQRPVHELEDLADDGRSINDDKSPTRLRPGSNSLSTPTELRASGSFERRDSRPTTRRRRLTLPMSTRRRRHLRARPNLSVIVAKAENTDRDLELVVIPYCQTMKRYNRTRALRVSLIGRTTRSRSHPGI